MGFSTYIEPLLQHLKVTEGLDDLTAIAGAEGLQSPCSTEHLGKMSGAARAMLFFVTHGSADPQALFFCRPTDHQSVQSVKTL